MTSVVVLNGPNLNLLGTRRPEIYGRTTLAEVEAMCREEAQRLGLELDFRQSNHEGQLVDWIQEVGREAKAGRAIGAVLNAAAFTHTSVALHDAVEAVELPVIELHISNIHRREPLYHNSLVSKVATAVIAGLGANGYPVAIRAMQDLLR